MLKIKSMKDIGSVNVDLIITTDHTGEETDFIVRISRELLANMTIEELKTELMDHYKVFYRDYLDMKVEELLEPLYGVDLTIPPEPEEPEAP